MAALTFEGYVIVSADGMLADAGGLMPESLKFDADQQFFSSSLDRADLIVHGRNSFEDQPNSPKRTRIVLTRSTPGLARHPDNPKATLWNPAGASFEDACAIAGVASGTAAIIGGPGVFAMFANRYDTFWLSEAERVRVPGGEGAFPDVPRHTPQAILASWGLKADAPRMLDAAQSVTVTPWRRG
ncbi:MAG: dihydrofolate reductase [Proteobacteria bacterium SG_bin9]|nr:MAG: dihydrofolate reductase [Proteobacteria bacterium SG_bin9]